MNKITLTGEIFKATSENLMAFKNKEFKGFAITSITIQPVNHSYDMPTIRNLLYQSEFPVRPVTNYAIKIEYGCIENEFYRGEVSFREEDFCLFTGKRLVNLGSEINFVENNSFEIE